MKLVIVRHGETEWNLQHRAMGQLDSPLTSKGIRQACALGDRLRRFSFTTLYSSDLGRAAQTANIIASKCEKKVIFDSQLREWNMGIFQGLTISQMQQNFPQEWQDYQQIGFNYIIPEGESLRQLRQRSFQCFNAIAKRHIEENVVVVTHGYTLMAFFKEVLGLPPGNTCRFKLDNANFCVFEYIDHLWSLVVWNDVSHLENIESLEDTNISVA